MDYDDEGFLYPKVDTTKCLGCNVCVSVCFVKKERKQISSFELFAAKCNDDTIRFSSSSGGIFTSLAQWIIKQDGVVFGAGYDQNFDVYHSYALTDDELSKHKKSKYSQSDNRNSFKEVKMFLELGKKVLFSGLPCQVAGLKEYLQADYDNLYSIDLMCSSVASPKVWKSYISWLEDVAKSQVASVTFRDKEIDGVALRPNQGNISIKIFFKNNTQIYQRYGVKENESSFFAGFIAKLFCRPSCHNCPTRCFTSGSDLTIGDFWGIEQIRPEICDRHEDGTVMPFGVSEVIVLNEKGKTLFNNIRDNISCIRISETDIEKMKRFPNWHVLFSSSKPHINRDKFFNDFIVKKAKGSIDSIIRKHLS